jgi:competence ComEA-like helix-hairpin-helix protein
MKRWMKDYFSFSRRDRIAIWVLVLLIFLTLLLPYFFNNAIHTRPGETDTAWIALVKALEVKQDSEHLVRYRQKRVDRKPFGRPYQDSGIKWKGSRFSAQKERAWPSNRYVRKKLSPININEADTSAFISLPGIGSRLADRIIRFREKLGGFYSIDQIAEVYGLADSVFQKIKPLLQLGPFTINKIDINTATLEELKAHPYIKYAIANSIVQYRCQHGTFSTMEDLKKIVLITAEVYRKISAYLTTVN